MPKYKFKGMEAAMKRLRSLNDPQAEKRMSAALYVAGDMLRVEAAISISTGSVSGEHHVPSKPGEPPMMDTGFLASQIETRQPVPLTVEVSSNAPYSAALELGTSKMAARPFMRPAAAMVRGKAERLIAAALRDEFRKARK